MIDRFENTSTGLDSPAFDAFAISPNDNADLPEITRALYIGGDGDIVLTTKGGTQITFTGVIASSFLPIRASRILATGTTAANIVGLI